MPGSSGESELVHETAKNAPHPVALQTASPMIDEDEVLVAVAASASHQITLQASGYGVVQWNEAALAELRVADQQAIGRDVGQAQAERLPDA